MLKRLSVALAVLLFLAGVLLAGYIVTGRAYAFEWPKAGDLEAAVGMPLWDRTAHKPTGTQAR